MNWGLMSQENTVCVYRAKEGYTLRYIKMLKGYGWQLRQDKQLPSDCIAANFDIPPNQPAVAFAWAEKEIFGLNIEQLPEQTFWVVWNPTNRNPMIKHPYLRDAKKEAERLAVANKGQEFYVLRSVGRAKDSGSLYTEINPTNFDKKELERCGE